MDPRDEQYFVERLDPAKIRFFQFHNSDSFLETDTEGRAFNTVGDVKRFLYYGGAMQGASNWSDVVLLGDDDKPIGLDDEALIAEVLGDGWYVRIRTTNGVSTGNEGSFLTLCVCVCAGEGARRIPSGSSVWCRNQNDVRTLHDDLRRQTSIRGVCVRVRDHRSTIPRGRPTSNRPRSPSTHK